MKNHSSFIFYFWKKKMNESNASDLNDCNMIENREIVGKDGNEAFPFSSLLCSFYYIFETQTYDVQKCIGTPKQKNGCNFLFFTV